MILAIETAARVGGIALRERGVLLGERVLGETHSQHAAGLLPAVDDLLRELGRPLDAVETIALSIGPGSFTGLRIGLASALGLCFGTARSIVPVPTLAALSLNAGEVSGPIAPLLDARKGQVYAGLYTARANALLEDRVSDPLPFLEALAARGEPVWLLGPGARLFRNEIRTVLGARGQLLGSERDDPRARQVAELGERLLKNGAALAPEQVQLRYLRAAEAQEKRAAGHGSGDPIS